MNPDPYSEYWDVFESGKYGTTIQRDDENPGPFSSDADAAGHVMERAQYCADETARNAVRCVVDGWNGEGEP